jgi:hypothetical protein
MRAQSRALRQLACHETGFTMTKERRYPDWGDYEKQVFEEFKVHLPEARIRRNVRIKGRFSKRRRQIDILISEATPTGRLKTVVDTKCFKRKVDVKAVDALAGFVEDVRANRGMLITGRGYTKAALNRAFYGPSNLELDILNFSELKRFQGFCAIPYSGENAFVVPAPFGWVIDATQGKGCLARMYQRGLDAETALKRKEFLYINFWNRKRESLTAAELDERQVATMRAGGPVSVIHRATVRRPDAVTRLRLAEVARYKCLEVTGFLEFKDVIFFAVLLTPRETQVPNIRRLETVLARALPMKVTYDHRAAISGIQNRLKGPLTPTERGTLLRRLGHLYREMKHDELARQALEESITLDDKNRYWTIRELLPVLANLGDKNRALEVMGVLLQLDPHNPTVFNDCFNFAAGWIERSALLRLFDALKADRPRDQLVQANCDLYAGTLLRVDSPSTAKQRYIAARKIFRDLFPRKHYVFRLLRRALRWSNEAKQSALHKN